MQMQTKASITCGYFCVAYSPIVSLFCAKIVLHASNGVKAYWIADGTTVTPVSTSDATATVSLQIRMTQKNTSSPFCDPGRPTASNNLVQTNTNREQYEWTNKTMYCECIRLAFHFCNFLISRRKCKTFYRVLNINRKSLDSYNAHHEQTPKMDKIGS